MIGIFASSDWYSPWKLPFFMALIKLNRLFAENSSHFNPAVNLLFHCLKIALFRDKSQEDRFFMLVVEIKLFYLDSLLIYNLLEFVESLEQLFDILYMPKLNYHSVLGFLWRLRFSVVHVDGFQSYWLHKMWLLWFQAWKCCIQRFISV